MVHVMTTTLLFTFPINNYVKAFNLAFHQVMTAQKRPIRSWSRICFHFCGRLSARTWRKAEYNEVVEWAPLMIEMRVSDSYSMAAVKSFQCTGYVRTSVVIVELRGWWKAWQKTLEIQGSLQNWINFMANSCGFPQEIPQLTFSIARSKSAFVRTQKCHEEARGLYARRFKFVSPIKVPQTATCAAIWRVSWGFPPSSGTGECGKFR